MGDGPPRSVCRHGPQTAQVLLWFKRLAKRVVWEAYRHVKANRGAAGIDGKSMEMFEANLKDNLYRVWNRMSSGSYMPPAIRLVEIPKKTGGVRVLGIATIEDRIAQTVAKIVRVKITRHQCKCRCDSRKRRRRLQGLCESAARAGRDRYRDGGGCGITPEGCGAEPSP
jgi:retron-type reverse transcriptase